MNHAAQDLKVFLGTAGAEHKSPWCRPGGEAEGKQRQRRWRRLAEEVDEEDETTRQASWCVTKQQR